MADEIELPSEPKKYSPVKDHLDILGVSYVTAGDYNELRAVAEKLRAEKLLAENEALRKEAAKRIVAKPLVWDESLGQLGQWDEKTWGFSIQIDSTEGLKYEASWGEGDAETFHTMSLAQQWCQEQADDFIKRSAMQSDATDSEALRKFAKRVMECWPDGDVDGGELQDAAITAGLLQENNRTTTCGEYCRCADYYTEAERAEGFICYTKTPLLTGAAALDEGKKEV